jgi:hypothetical protein
MSSGPSVAEILANLEAQMAFHKEREEHHARQEALHQEQRATHAAEYETIARHYEAFKASAGGAVEIAARASAPVEKEPEPPAPVKPSTTSKLVDRLLAELPASATFTADQVAAEVNQRYRSELRRLVTPSAASTILRRRLAEGRLRLARKGSAHRQAVYARAVSRPS